MYYTFPEPCRSGKKFMLSMMEYFFNVRKDSVSLFEGLDITLHENFCREWMNQYPVLFVAFKVLRLKTLRMRIVC